MTTLFISDLHLTPQRPHITELFVDLLRGEAARADGLYILGDLFEYWIGDDAADHLGYTPVIQALRELSESGVPIRFMRGNRDFLVGERFAGETGCAILPDPTVVDLYGEPVALTHGDYLCTDDTEHQAFRATVDNPAWQREFLGQSIEARMQMAENARKESHAHKGSVSMEIMDVNPAAVEKAFDDHGVRLMIHGHTHRPAVHHHGDFRRIVLGDWYEQSSVLRCRPGEQILDPEPD